MYPVILASPPVGRPTQATDWRGLSITWEGPDGQTWDLTDRAGGVLLTAQGLEGLHNPRITKYASASRAIPGKRLRGWRAEARDVFWPLYIWADGSTAWRDRQQEFFDSITPDREGTWRVKAGEEERRLSLTGVFLDTHRYNFDPLITGWATYGVALEAAQPFWEGEPRTRGPWGSPNPVPFVPAGGGPPLRISSASTVENATIPNTGNVEAYGAWTLNGPLSDIVLGVGDALNVIPFSLEAGETLLIDTDPRRPSASINGVDSTTALGLQEWAPIPPGAEVPLHVAATGNGNVSFALTPLYLRAF